MPLTIARGSQEPASEVETTPSLDDAIDGLIRQTAEADKTEANVTAVARSEKFTR